MYLLENFSSIFFCFILLATQEIKLDHEKKYSPENIWLYQIDFKKFCDICKIS